MKLNKVTSNALLTLQKHNIHFIDPQQQVLAIATVSLDQESLREVCETIFDEDFSRTDWGEFDCTELTKGLNAFFKKWMNVSTN